MDVSAEIMEMVKDYLHITYELDASTQRRLESEASAGIAYIQQYCDPAADCRPGTEYGAMLCDYVLRAEAGALETFANDFATEISSARIRVEVDGYAGAMGYAETKDELSDVP